MPSRKLHILHTNDIHSRFENMPLIAGGIRKLKSTCEKQGDEVVIVDLGDHCDRMSPITEGSWGQANVDIMNETGYQFAAIGNNEGLTFPKDRFLSMYEVARFQVLCCNLLDESTGEIPPFIEPYVIQETSSLRIGWISATSPYPMYGLLGWQTLNPTDQTVKLVKKIRQQCDLIIILSHLGYQSDRAMAKEIDGIDIIIGAHTHDLLETGVYVNETFIIQAGKFGQYLGQTSIEYDLETKQMIGITGMCHEVKQFEKDRQIEALISKKQVEADFTLGSYVTELDQPLITDWQQESPFGNLLAEGIRDWVEAEISMVNAGQLLNSLPQGVVTRKDLLTLCPHPINPCKVYIKGKYIKQLLEQALDDDNIHRQVKGLGFRGEVLGWMCVDGLSIHYNPVLASGYRIVGMTVHGSPFQDERVYSVGTVDMFTFGWIFPLFSKAERVQYFLPELIRDVLEKELQKDIDFVRSKLKRWIPV